MKTQITINHPQHTDEIQDIITTPPSWLLRWGISLFFITLVMLVIISAFITYPDTVKTQLKIYSSNPAKTISATASGRLIKLLVQNNQTVKQAQPLAYIESVHGKDSILAPQAGELNYMAILYQNQQIAANQPLFNIITNEGEVFGEMTIPQASMGKVRAGQDVMIKLKNYPAEEYGMMHGTIEYIATVPFKEAMYIAKVNFKVKNMTDMKKPVSLKQGMIADAEIVTQNYTVLQRLTRGITQFSK